MIELPPLPENTLKTFLALMDAYARQAVLQERERCAKLCEEAKGKIWQLHDIHVRDASANVCDNLAAAIRSQEG